MIKIAFFVEGKTERIFIEKFLDSFYTHPFFNMESYEVRGGRAQVVTKSHYEDDTVGYSFLIFDVGGDGSLASAIYERSEKLIDANGFSHIFGIRDLFPSPLEQLNLVEASFQNIFNDNDILQSITLVIAIMEVEAWFLADYDFFLKVDPTLTTRNINKSLDINIEEDSIERYRHPAKMIDRIYQLAGKRYKKRESDSHSICSRLDFDDLYLNQNKRERIPSFDFFVNKLAEF